MQNVVIFSGSCIDNSGTLLKQHKVQVRRGDNLEIHYDLRHINYDLMPMNI